MIAVDEIRLFAMIVSGIVMIFSAGLLVRMMINGVDIGIDDVIFFVVIVLLFFMTIV